MALEQHVFGSGVMSAIPLGIAVPTPVEFGTLQEVSVGMSFSEKLLYGQNQDAVAIGRGTRKIECKAKFAKVRAADFNSIFIGQTVNAGRTATVQYEGGPLGAAPTTNAITVVNSSTWVEDLGVWYAATGRQLQCVSSAPTVGQYSVAAGVYTFAAGDSTNKFVISYDYTITTGSSIISYNQLTGSAPTFKVNLAGQFGGNGMNLTLFSCTASKLTLNFKNEDFVIPEIDFTTCADFMGRVFAWGSDL